jgi:hypothetical protein
MQTSADIIGSNLHIITEKTAKERKSVRWFSLQPVLTDYLLKFFPLLHIPQGRHSYNEPEGRKHICCYAQAPSAHLCRLFKSITGMPPIVLCQLFMDKAAMALLQEHYLSVAEVALTAGFNDSNYFLPLIQNINVSSPLLY